MARLYRAVAIHKQGNSALFVESISTSCGCTEAELDSMSIAPGQSSELTISFDSGAHGLDVIGEVTRQIFIASNDPNQPEFGNRF